MQRLKGKIALVTGSGAGIGESICMRFAREGATLVGMDLNLSEAERVTTTIRAEGGKAYAQSGNVSIKTDCARVVNWVKINLGSINVLCNVAGIVETGTLIEASEQARLLPKVPRHFPLVWVGSCSMAVSQPSGGLISQMLLVACPKA